MTQLEDIVYPSGEVIGKFALLVDIYGVASEMSGHCRTLLERCLALSPASDDLHILTGNSRKFKSFGARARTRVLKQLEPEAIAARTQWGVIKDGPHFDINNFVCEYYLGQSEGDDPEIAATKVFLTLPSTWASEEHVEELVARLHQLVADLPVWWVVASLGYSCIWGREFEQIVEPAAFRTGMRYHGLLLRARSEDITEWKAKLKTGGWLTALGPRALEMLGGADAIRGQLSAQVQAEQDTAGLWLRAGVTPPLCDVNRQGEDMAALAEVQRALEPIRMQEWELWRVFRVEEEDDAHVWLHRFEQSQ